MSHRKILRFPHWVAKNTNLVDEVTDDLDSLGLLGDVVWVLFALLLYDGDGEGCCEDILSLEDEALDRLSSSYEPSLSRVSASFIDLKDSKRSRSSSPLQKLNKLASKVWKNYMKLTYLIFNMIYLSGIRPSWPLTEPFHQSFETCLNKVKVSPLWKLISRADLALKSYKAWASKVSDSVKKKKKMCQKLCRKKKVWGKKIHHFFRTYFQKDPKRNLDRLSHFLLWKPNLQKNLRENVKD